MAFATRADYATALQHHRSWPTTIVLFVVTGLCALTVTVLISAFVGAGSLATIVAVPLVVGFVWTWMDAAQIAAGRRIGRS
jgi:hypothetical protein